MSPSDKRREYNRRYYLKRRQQKDQGEERKTNVSLRLPASLIGRLHRLVGEGIHAGKWPWKTVSECVNALVVRGLQASKHDDTIDEMLPYLEAQAQIDRIQQIRREAQGLLNKTRQEINEFLGIGATDGAVRYFHVTLDAANRMPPTEWRDWLIKMLRKEFPALAKQKAPGIRLVTRKRKGR